MKKKPSFEILCIILLFFLSFYTKSFPLLALACLPYTEVREKAMEQKLFHLEERLNNKRLSTTARTVRQMDYLIANLRKEVK